MHVRDWERFYRVGHGSAITIAQLSQEMADHLGASSRAVTVHHDVLRKAVEKHSLTPAHFPMIFETVDLGRALADRDKHVTFFYFEEYVFGRWFQVTVKCGGEARRLFVATFHKQKAEEVARKTRKFVVLRP